MLLKQRGVSEAETDDIMWAPRVVPSPVESERVTRRNCRVLYARGMTIPEIAELLSIAEAIVEDATASEVVTKA